MREDIALELIDPNPWQPRTSEDPETVEKIGLSIQTDGLLQPPVARQVPPSNSPQMGEHNLGGVRYQLAFGHTRLAAFRWLKERHLNGAYSKMPLEVVDLTDEAMYRHAVTENLQRKDLTPIEEARAMKRAMEDFGYNSVKVGELFGKSDATVRGTVRLLDLDEDFKTRLDAGEMTVGAARKVLAMQRSLKPEDMQKLKSDGSMSMDEIIRGEIDNIYSAVGKSLIRMHSRWDSHDPKGGPGLWPLTWTYDTPPYTVPTDKQSKKIWAGDEKRHGRKVIDVAHEFIRSIVSIHPGMEKSWEQLYAEDGDRWGDVLDLLKQLMQPPACTACEHYIKQDGNHYCALKACHENKVRVWGEAALERLSKELDIPIYDPGQDGKEIIKLEYSYDDRQKKWWNEKPAGLRLMLKKSQYSHAFTGHPAILAVLTGETARKIVEKERKAKEKAKANAPKYTWEEAWEIKNRRREAFNAVIYRFVWDQAAPVLGEVFGKLSAGILEDLSSGYRLPDGVERKTASLTALVAYGLLMNKHDDGLVKEPYNSKSLTPVQDAAKHLQGVAKAWGVKLPADWLEVAQGYEPEGYADLVAAAVAVETEGG